MAKSRRGPALRPDRAQKTPSLFPPAELARQRAATRTRVKSHRKQKAALDGERERGAVESDTQEPDVTKTGGLAPVAAMPNVGALDKVEIERQDLIVWVKQASIEEVRFATNAIYLEYGFFLGKTSGNRRSTIPVQRD